MSDYSNILAEVFAPKRALVCNPKTKEKEPINKVLEIKETLFMLTNKAGESKLRSSFLITVLGINPELKLYSLVSAAQAKQLSERLNIAIIRKYKDDVPDNLKILNIPTPKAKVKKHISVSDDEETDEES